MSNQIAPLKFTYCILRRMPDGTVKAFQEYDSYADAIVKRDELRAMARRKESKAAFYVKMHVTEVTGNA